MEKITRERALTESYLKWVLGDEKRALDEDGVCSYKGKVRGTACAIGQYIPEELYEETMEGQGAKRLFENSPELIPLFEGAGDPNHVEFWAELQGVHDRRDEGVRAFAAERLGREYGIQLPVVTPEKVVFKSF